MCNYLNVSAVKKLIHDKERRCGPEFLVALDKMIMDKVNQTCDLSNDGLKTIKALATDAPAPPTDSVAGTIAAIAEEAAFLELKTNSITKGEYVKSVNRIQSLCKKFSAKVEQSAD